MPRYEKRHRDTVGTQSPVAAGGGLASPPRTVYPRGGKPSRRGKGVPVRLLGPNGESKMVGLIEHGPYGLVLEKRVKASRHLFRAADAWGVDAAVLKSAAEAGVQTIRVTDTETGTVYSVSLSHFLAHGFRRNFGHGEQVFLPRSEWAKAPGGQLQMMPA
jgi:hypothetical protein